MPRTKEKEIPKFTGRLALAFDALSILRRSLFHDGLTKEFDSGKADLEEILADVFGGALDKMGGRLEKEKAVFASIVFWDWWGADWFSEIETLEEPKEFATLRHHCKDDLTDVDDVTVGAGLVIAGYSPEWAARRLMSYHGNSETGRTAEEAERDARKLEREIRAELSLPRGVKPLWVLDKSWRKLETK